MQYYAISNLTSHFSNFSRFLTNFEACRSGGVKDSQSQTDQLPPDCTLVFFLQEILFTRNLIVYKRLCPAVSPSVGPMVHEQESVRKNKRFGWFCAFGGNGMGVERPFPPIRDNIVTLRHMLYHY